MLLDVCPILDELRLFLDEQLELSRQEGIGSHVDACRSCQATLEELIQVESSDLPGARHGASPQSHDLVAEATAPANQPRGVSQCAEESPYTDTDAEGSSRFNIQPHLIDDGVTTDLPRSERRSDGKPTDPEELAGPV